MVEQQQQHVVAAALARSAARSPAGSVADCAASVVRASSFARISGTSAVLFAITPRNVHGSQMASMHSG